MGLIAGGIVISFFVGLSSNIILNNLQLGMAFLLIAIDIGLCIFRYLTVREDNMENKTSEYKLYNPSKILYAFIILLIIYFLIQIISYFIPSDNLFYFAFKASSEIYNINTFLFIVTFLNAYFAYMMVFEMRKTREFQFNPKLTANIEPLGTNLTVIRIKNVGNGSAYGIKMNYNVKDDAEIKIEKAWNSSLLQTTEFVRLVIEEPFLEFYKKYSSIEFSLSYLNSNKIEFKEEINLNLKELGKGITENLWLQEVTTEEDIHDISKHIKDISNFLKK